jgi:hypothetical protein
VIFENLSQHIADIHFSDHLYWCEQCDVQFSSSSELYLHFQEHSLMNSTCVSSVNMKRMIQKTCIAMW